MKRYAHIENGIVTNISLWDGGCEYNPGENVTKVLADDNARIGGTYDGAFHYVAPTPPEPTPEEAAAAETRSSAIGKLKALGLNDAEIASIAGG